MNTSKGSLRNDTKEERENGAVSSSYEPVATIMDDDGSGTTDSGTAGIVCIEEQSSNRMTVNHGDGLEGEKGEQPILPPPHSCCYCCCNLSPCLSCDKSHQYCCEY
mmetsp:Transcript_57113/g.61821  ORF Transcript_57113/g.61821 Transcript_57113/m.61821 type:complete len:106 (+) Transcript_57113:160-477(+)